MVAKQIFRGFLFAALFAVVQSAHSAPPEYARLTQAYEALRSRSYDAAIAAFLEAIAAAPARPDIRKDVAYVFLKIGDNDAAREQLGIAMKLDPSDQAVALEFAFLSFENRTDPVPSKALARRIFDRIRDTGDVTAEQAFQNIDRPLQDGIAQWTRALEAGPPSFSVHYELAQLAEQRDDLTLAANHYLKAHEMLPARYGVLLDLARVYKGLNLSGEAMAALLAASRCGEPRAAELAREQLPARYPYLYEFRQALRLDPGNVALHRELAYLLLAMKDSPAAEAEFKSILQTTPDDHLAAAQLSFLSSKHDPRTMADRSLEAGFLKDALRYLRIAQESDPSDYGIALKLAWTYNMLHEDREAIEWFDRARKSPDASIAAEASRAYENLRADSKLIRTTAWVLPFYSSRWHNGFGYGQIKAELNTGHVRVRPYFTTRLIADTRPAAQGQPLSERSFIVGLGLAGQWHRFTGWAEAGSAINYTRTSMKPDYRGGLSWARAWTGERKFFAEVNADEVFISRFGNDWLSYLQWRGGYRWAVWNVNLTADTNRQHWANFAEAGPGIRFHVPNTPKTLLFSMNYLRGWYLVGGGAFSDVRVGFWYAISK